MDVTEGTEPPVCDRKQKNVAAAQTSNANKRDRMGEEAYLQEKRVAAKAYRRRLKETGAAAANSAAPSAGIGALPSAVVVPVAVSVPVAAPPVVDVATQLATIAQLKAAGDLTEEEFVAAKAKILAPPAPAPAP